MPDSDVHCVIINLHFCTTSLSLATLICCPWRRTLITVLWSSCCGTTCHSFIICFKPLLPLAAHSDLTDQQLFYSAIYIKDLSSNICLSLSFYMWSAVTTWRTWWFKVFPFQQRQSSKSCSILWHDPDVFMIITVAVASSSLYAAVTDQDPSSSFLSIPTTTNFGVKTQNLILSVGEKSSSWISWDLVACRKENRDQDVMRNLYTKRAWKIIAIPYLSLRRCCCCWC